MGVKTRGAPGASVPIMALGQVRAMGLGVGSGLGMGVRIAWGYIYFDDKRGIQRVS